VSRVQCTAAKITTFLKRNTRIEFLVRRIDIIRKSRWYTYSSRWKKKNLLKLNKTVMYDCYCGRLWMQILFFLLLKTRFCTYVSTLNRLRTRYDLFFFTDDFGWTIFFFTKTIFTYKKFVFRLRNWWNFWPIYFPDSVKFLLTIRYSRTLLDYKSVNA